MRDTFETAVTLAADHPLIAVGLGLVLTLVLVLGAMHVIRIFGGMLVLLIREFKHEAFGIKKVARDVREELTSWGEE